MMTTNAKSSKQADVMQFYNSNKTTCVRWNEANKFILKVSSPKCEKCNPTNDEITDNDVTH